MADVRGPHPYHDPILVTSLLDDDLAADERAAAEAAIAGCPECLALRADLRALATATRRMPTPPRPRAFLLTIDDAARLSAMDAGEPGRPAPRLTDEMTGPTTSADHASHDAILVASLVDRSLPATDREIARAQVASCGPCAALYADLDALRAATRVMPTPPRPRDYALTPDDAARLRPSGWRRWIAALGSSRDAFSRPLAVGLTTLGLAGLLIANVPSISFGGATSGAAPVVGDTAGPASGSGGDMNLAPEAGGSQQAPGAAAGAPTGDPAPPARDTAQPIPVRSGGTTVQAADPSGPRAPEGMTDGGPTDTSGSGKSGTGKGSNRLEGAVGSESDASPVSPTVPPLVLLSGSMLIVGIGLFTLRWGARRFGD